MKIPILYAPTASGKSAAALTWAETHNGTIINADALQIYNALPILTAQPDAAERARVPHELYGTIDPLTPVSAASWAEEAATRIQSSANPILVGGTGLYIKTLIEGIAPIPDTDPDIRHDTEQMYLKLGPDRFQAELEKIDPKSSYRIEPNNRQRMIRAMEVFKQTGRSMTDWHNDPKKRFIDEALPVKIIVFLPDKEWVKERAMRRAKLMLKNGALEEVAEFGHKYGAENPAAKALGFAPLWAHVQGKMTREDAQAQLLQDTNAYIKRQLTWGRTQMSKMAGAHVVTNAKQLQIDL